MAVPRKILIIQLRRIGDVLLSTPVIRALKTRFPKSCIAFLVERESADILTLNPYLDEVIVLERERYRNPFYSLRKIWQIRRRGFDLVIDFLGNPRTAYITFLSGAGRRMGYDVHWRRFYYNLLIKDDGRPKYSATHKLEALKSLGIDASDLRPDFLISEEARLFSQSLFQEAGVDPGKLIISLSPTSRRHFRRWHLERFARLADWLISRFQATVVLVWGPGERGVVEKVGGLMEQKPLISPETEDLFRLGAILQKCDLHIGNDNGTKHVAVAMGKPTLTIYGPQDPVNWTYPEPARHKFLKKKADCPDCDRMKHRCEELSCLDEITLEDVQGVFLQLLRDLEKGKEREVVEKIERLAVDQR
ncbi:MAG: glycosyltransferase family 9 protein [Candidatus Zixiibacteriota bacterium]|nr:MAG: glycosyltransferase family 9 protein [candidate division Zixibacteria bacterium]